MIILGEIGKFILALICVVIAFYVIGTIFGGFGALVSWNWLILTDVWMFWTTPTYLGLRVFTWFFALIFGFGAVYSEEGMFPI